jgi:LysR family glycine cleavage system transcriptional activator
MSSALPTLGWIRTFEAAARRLSFVAAAKELDITPAAASQHVRALERQLGFALFERLPRGVALTPMGAAYLPSVRRALDELALATAGLFGAAARRRLTLRCIFSFAALRLAPRLPDFLRANPGVALRLLTAVWSDGPADDDLDVDIRYGDWAAEGAEVVRLSAPVAIPICPPGTELDPDPAAGLRSALGRGAIHVMGCENLWARFARERGWPDALVAGGPAVDSSVVALEMVAAGAGCALIERDLALGHVAAGRVAAPAGLALAHDQAHYAALPRRARPPSPAALLFRAWLRDAFAEAAA